MVWRRLEIGQSLDVEDAQKFLGQSPLGKIYFGQSSGARKNESREGGARGQRARCEPTQANITMKKLGTCRREKTDIIGNVSST